MKVKFLGTGTSQGIPVLGCGCAVCASKDIRDERLRSSVFIQLESHKVLIDCGPDFRQQALTAHIADLDVILLTHEHNDHIIGMDDLRPFLFRKKEGRLDIYALPRVKEELKKRFPYAFENQAYPGAPKFDIAPIHPRETFFLGTTKVQAIPVMHGQLPILGYRLDDFAYLTDVRYLPGDAMEALRDLKVLVINALQHRTHHSHLNWEQAIELAGHIGARHTYFTHISHYLGTFAELNEQLGPKMHLAYDGLELEL